MKTTLSRESPSKVRVSVVASPEEVRPALERAVRALGEKVKVPGFRKGKVPRKVLETRVGIEAIREATLREAIPELLAKAVESEALAPIAPPRVEVSAYDLDAELTFDALVEIRPEIELPDLSGIPVTRPASSATPKEIEEQLRRVQERFATLEPVDRPARRGDFVLIEVAASAGQEAVPELSARDQLYEIGAGFVVPRLDDELENATAGDQVAFEADVPADLGPPHAGKTVSFKVAVKEVRRKVLPEIDDELARTASEFDTLAELRSDLGERIRKVKVVHADGEVRQRILEHLLDEVEVEAPGSLVDEEVAYRVARLEDQLRAAGMTLDRYLEASGRSAEDVEADLRRQAERNVRAQLILEEVGRRESFTVTQDELADEVRSHAEAMRVEPSELAQKVSEGGRVLALAGDILRRKALNLLVERADIREEEAAAPESGESPTSGAAE